MTVIPGGLNKGIGRAWRIVPAGAAAVFFAVVVPFLELNDSHLFNPNWPPHARLHEAWQLLTNGGLVTLALWLAVNGRERLGSGLALLVVAPLLLAYGLRNAYGGSMDRQGGADHLLSNSGAIVVAMTLLSISLCAIVALRQRSDLRGTG